MAELIAPQIKITAQQRQALMGHKDFIEMFAKEVESISFPKDEIPDWFRRVLTDCLYEIPYTAMGNITMEVYKELVNDDPKGFALGVLQKAIDIVFTSAPKHLSITRRELGAYIDVIETCGKMADKMQELLNPARDKVVEKLWVREKLNNNGQLPAAQQLKK